MSDSQKLSVIDLAKLVNGSVVGDGALAIINIANLDSAAEHEIAYVDSEKFFDAADSSRASCLIIPKNANRRFNRPAVIEVSNPKLAFSIIAAALHPPKRRDPTIHPSACVAETADIALMSDDLSKLPYTIKLSRRALMIIKQNITFSLAIKLVALLLVVPGWLTLWIAIFADMGATLIVTLNSLRLLKVKE